jgi:hypothetical protein
MILMKKLLLLLTVCGLIGAQSFGAGPNLIVNGDFESDAQASGTFSNRGTLTGWTITGDVDLVGENYPQMPTDNATQYIDLNGQGGTGTNAVVEQTFATTAAATYTVSVSYAQNKRGHHVSANANPARGLVQVSPATVGGQSSSVSLQLNTPCYVEGGTVDTNKMPTLIKGSHEWAPGPTNFTFTAHTTSTTIKLISSDSRPSGGILIDDVSVTAN